MQTQGRINRRSFLAAMGLTVGGALALRSAPSAGASVFGAKARAVNDSLFRRGKFRRGQVWNFPGGTLKVRGRRGIRSLEGGTRFDRNSFEVLFTKVSGKHPGHGTVTITRPDGTRMPVHLVQIGPNRYSAVINREQITGAKS